MLYAIISTDVADSLEKRMASRPAHLARRGRHLREGKHGSGGRRQAT
ncbi:YciI family protein, partial [Metapseudomonas otitidis]